MLAADKMLLNRESSSYAAHQWQAFRWCVGLNPDDGGRGGGGSLGLGYG